MLAEERRIEEGDRQAGGHRDMVCINKLRKVYGNKKVRREGRGERGRQRREGRAERDRLAQNWKRAGWGRHSPLKDARCPAACVTLLCLCDAPLLV